MGCSAPEFTQMPLVKLNGSQTKPKVMSLEKTACVHVCGVDRDGREELRGLEEGIS